MSLVLFGLNHDTAPLEVRERVAFTEDMLPSALRSLKVDADIEEALILSTCNRTEIYCNTLHPEKISAWLKSYHGADLSSLDTHFYTALDTRAVDHLFRVASGLDSMVIGEAQILGQVKYAARVAQEEGTLGWLLHRAFQQAFNVAKYVRTHTAIGAESVSMAAAALRLAAQVLGPLEGQRVLLIGAGEMVELIATHVAQHSPAMLAVTNRTYERAERLAERFKARALPLSDLPHELSSFDLVMSCTAASLPLIGKGMVETAIKARRHRPMVMIDFAVPRDIEPEVGMMEDVFLYTVDDLGRLIKAGQDARLRAAEEAKSHIESEVEEFSHWLQGRAVVPVIRQLRSHVDAYRHAELERAKRQLQAGESPERVLEQLSQGLMNKFLHHPTHLLNAVDAAEQRELMKWLPKLFPVASDE